MYVIAVCGIGFLAFAALMLVWGASDRRAAEERRGWRLRCVSAGSWTYEEKADGGWRPGVVMQEVSDFREAPHHLQIMSVQRWTEYPAWTHGRRDEILARIRSQLKEPDYVLHEA